MIKVSWTKLKPFLEASRYPYFFIDLDDAYEIDCNQYHCQIPKDDGADQTDFEDNFKSNGNKPVINEVTTQYEKNDKTLRCFRAITETDADGLAEFCIKVPEPSRWIAYGDIEFEEREFGDYISLIEIIDHERLIAWQIALAIDPDATEPVSDATVLANGYPLYPVIGHYDERNLETTDFTKGSATGGIGMTFQYGITEAEPIGGYGYLPAGMYLRIIGKKKTAVSGKKCQLSIDWAEPNG